MVAPRVAEACNDQFCSHLLVRGDRIEFVSQEQFKRTGGIIDRSNPPPGPGWSLVEDEHGGGYWAPPSDVDNIPREMVLVHDTTGALLPKCELFIVRWRAASTSPMRPDDAAAAQQYFRHGDDGKKSAKVQSGEVDIPEGPWRRVCKVKIIRYRRARFRRGLDHPYDPAVWLYSQTRPLAFRLSLPAGCIVTEFGFEKP